jgi:hypothetical protein
MVSKKLKEYNFEQVESVRTWQGKQKEHHSNDHLLADPDYKAHVDAVVAVKTRWQDKKRDNHRRHAALIQRQNHAWSLRDAGVTIAPLRIRSSSFKTYYTAGQVPCMVDHRQPGKLGIRWSKPFEQLNISKYLPLFYDGVREKEDHLIYVAKTGSMDMLKYVKTAQAGNSIVSALPALVDKMRKALSTRDLGLIMFVVETIDILLDSELGPAMTPFYRGLLPVLAANWKNKQHLGVRIMEIVEKMEQKGAGM